MHTTSMSYSIHTVSYTHLENSIAGREVDLEDGTSREQRRRLLRYARENTKKKAKDEPVSLEEKKVLEDVLQEFFA